MTLARTHLLALCVAAACAGCSGITPSAVRSSDADELARCLPAGVGMSSVLPDSGGTTVARKLAELGAYAEDGKLYDRSGKPIRFLTGVTSGAQPPPELEERRAKEEEELRRNYTVIDLRLRGV
jgi:hypothetical protein